MVMLGSGGVGKTWLVLQFVSGVVVERYDPTIEDFHRKEVDINGEPAILEILDTEQFASKRDLYIKNGEGFMLVYSITNAQTFIDVQPLRDQIARVKGRFFSPIVLVGNKCDLEGERSVARRDGEMLAHEWGKPFFETSAKTGYCTTEAFQELARQIMRVKERKKRPHCVCL